MRLVSAYVTASPPHIGYVSLYGSLSVLERLVG
jgi:hypothetical protein